MLTTLLLQTLVPHDRIFIESGGYLSLAPPTVMPRQSAATSSLHSPSRTARSSRNHHGKLQQDFDDSAFHVEYPGGRHVAAAMPLSSPLPHPPLSDGLPSWSSAPPWEAPANLRALPGRHGGNEVLDGRCMSTSDGRLATAGSNVVGYRMASQEVRLASMTTIQRQRPATPVRVDHLSPKVFADNIVATPTWSTASREFGFGHR